MNRSCFLLCLFISSFFLFDDDGIVGIDAGDSGKRVVLDVMVAEELSAFGESFLNQKAHTDDLGTGLTAEINHTTGSMSVRQEIIDEDDFIIFRKKIFSNTDRRIVGFGEGVHPRLEGLVHILGIVLFDEDHGQIHEVTEHNGRRDTGGFNRHNTRSSFVLENALELLGTSHSELRINLVVDEAANQDDITFGFADSLLYYPLFKFLHIVLFLSFACAIRVQRYKNICIYQNFIVILRRNLPIWQKRCLWHTNCD